MKYILEETPGKASYLNHHPEYGYASHPHHRWNEHECTGQIYLEHGWINYFKCLKCGKKYMAFGEGDPDIDDY